jgi:glycosyltransferase involved in cell wall biosynthesis
VLAFLRGPSAYAELAGLPKRSWGLVVSERSAGSRSRIRARLHMLADYMVVNSHAARITLEREHPGLRAKVVTLYNAVHIEPHIPVRQTPGGFHEVKLIVAARLDYNKNAQGLLAALQILKASQPSLYLRVDWYGNQKAEPDLFREMQDGITNMGLGGAFRLHPPTDNIHEMMSQAEAVMLPSFFEGLPNAVCEGMALRKPILMSTVSDAGNLVQDGVNGFLFDPHSPESIADAISRFAALSRDERVRMGEASHRKAEALFDLGSVADHYLRVLQAAAERKSVKIEHWPEEVPETALRPFSESNRGGLARG